MIPRAVPAQTLHRQALGLGLLALLLFCAGVYQQAVTGFDSRFVLFAKEMLRHGPGFFPTTYGQPYADYSSASTLLIYLFSLPFGRVVSLSAWLPTALASATIVSLIYRLLAPCSRTWALLSVALLLLSNTFICETRAVSLDQILAALALAVFYLGYAHDHFAAPRRLWLILALLVAGFAIRGPIGLVIPCGMLCSYYLLEGQWRRMLVFGGSALLLLLVCVALLLWLARLSGGPAFMQEVIRMQFTGRLDGSEGSSGPFYYFSSSLGNYALAYPLAILAWIGVLLAPRGEPDPALKLLRLCTAAGLLVMIGLSIPQAKKARYLLPMLPMAAIVAAYPFQARQGRFMAWLRIAIQGIWLLLPGLLIVGLLVLQRKFPEQLTDLTAMLALLGLLQGAALLMLVRPRWRAVGLAYTAVLAVWATYIGVFEPVERQLYDTRDFSLAAQRLIQSDPAPLVLHAMGKDAKAIKFMVHLDQDLQPLFTERPEALAAIPGPAWVIMDQSDLATLKATPLARLTPVLGGRFDKNDYVMLHLPATTHP
ncbi:MULTISPECIES: glycosyltransferase family 39 protein [Pseudomonas]|uniref:ArnT family glycosyltransferase n=1 Tax=Pseudomonas TaxID=286 RepID=UPI000B353972|nr:MULTISPECIES: phospholipid carrier-dependent glycosyltransferase [Pseudomonas]PMY60896.1 phospholipid carrier-dependent glycosyltransferase [Pseudomonas sp. FW305-25]PMY74398.1 phospholipid carrier-dependent glycosyltransferase [Pseudomonas sp. FW126-L8]PNA81793.1 phospholipid carrier-dependent glycosyltransferase [Pseudomonas sp. FW305-76]